MISKTGSNPHDKVTDYKPTEYVWITLGVVLQKTARSCEAEQLSTLRKFSVITLHRSLYLFFYGIAYLCRIHFEGVKQGQTTLGIYFVCQIHLKNPQSKYIITLCNSLQSKKKEVLFHLVQGNNTQLSSSDSLSHVMLNFPELYPTI